MTPKAKRLTAKEVIKILLKHGFEEISQTGSHIKFFNRKTRKTVIIPFHQGKELPIGTLSDRKTIRVRFNLKLKSRLG